MASSGMFVFLAVILSISRATGQSTGVACISSCDGLPVGDYQSCQDCHIFVTCTEEGLIDRRPCPAGLVWDDGEKRCEFDSTTCNPPPELRAVCEISAGSGIGSVAGLIEFTQKLDEDVSITVTLTSLGVPASLHGFHIHQRGSLDNQCSDAGGHYNPTGQTHGAPTDTVRHVGDLGNVVADSNGNLNTVITDSLVTLYGGRSVIERAVVVHAGEDDLGLGGNAGSLATGNAGGRLGCCTIKFLAVP